MNDLLIGLGVLLAIIGPLLLIPVVWILYRFILKPFFGSKKQALALAITLVAATLAATYIPGRRVFESQCEKMGRPVVSQQVNVKGFFRTAMFPYEAVLYLTQDGFEFVEAPDPFRDGVTIRYSKAPNGEVRQDEVKDLRSLYGVKKTYGLLQFDVSSTEKVVYELATGKQLGRATEFIYRGGPLSVFIGTMGMASCPDPRTPQGEKDFQLFVDLETYTLQAKRLP
jgi:hypothetical protein